MTTFKSKKRVSFNEVEKKWREARPQNLEIIRENQVQEILFGKPEELFSEEDSLTRKDNRDTPYTVLVET